MKKVFLHIGTHKTGTTSFQKFMSSNRHFMTERDVHFYSGSIIDDNHIELHVAASNQDNMSPIKHILNLEANQHFFSETTDRIQGFIKTVKSGNIVFSAEGMSYLRKPEELKKLKNIIGEESVKVLVCFRDKAEFLESYIYQLKTMGFSPAKNYERSFLYAEPDSWLVDYDELIDAYSMAFGKCNIIIKNYDDEMTKFGSIIPCLIDAIGLPFDFISGMDIGWLNKSI